MNYTQLLKNKLTDKLIRKQKIVVIKTRKSVGEILDLREIWSFRDLFFMLVRRDLIIRYQQTVFGVGWVLFKPLFSASIFTVLFGVIFHFPSGSLPYPVFVYSGLIFWNLFSSGISGASISLASADSLIKKVYFPRIIVPLANICTQLIDFGVSTAFLLIFLLLYHFSVPLISILAFLIAAALVAILIIGMSLYLAALNVKYRDVKQIIPFFIQMFIFLTPVIYPVSVVPERFRWILNFSPLATAIELFRSSLTGNILFNPISLAGSFIVASLALFLGLWYFSRSEWSFADIV